MGYNNFLVQYVDDGTRKHVVRKDFKAFFSNIEVSRKQWDVWYEDANGGSYYKAVVLKAAESIDELQQMLNEKRVPVPSSKLILDNSVDNNGHQGSLTLQKKKNKQTIQVTKQAIGKMNSVIIEQKRKELEKKKSEKRPPADLVKKLKAGGRKPLRVEDVFSSSDENGERDDIIKKDRKKNIHSVDSDDSDGNMIEPREHQKILKELNHVKILHKKALNRIQVLEEKLQAEEERNAGDTWRDRFLEVHQLNVSLQKQLLDMVSTRKDVDLPCSCAMVSTRKDVDLPSSCVLFQDRDGGENNDIEKENAKEFHDVIDAELPQASSSVLSGCSRPNVVLPSTDDNMDVSAVYDTRQVDTNCGIVNEIHLGGGIWIDHIQWSLLSQSSMSDSMFTKKLAMTIWGSDVLAQRTALGTKPNAAHGDNKIKRDPLTPAKVRVVEEKLRAKMERESRFGGSVQEVKVLKSSVNKYINEKCNTLRKINK